MQNEKNYDVLKKVAKGAGTTFIGKIVSSGLKYLTQMSIAWLGGVEIFGLYSLGFTIYKLAELFSCMGIEKGSVRYVSIHYSNGDTSRLRGVLLQAFGLSFLAGTIIGCTLFFSSSYIAQEIFKKPALIPVIKIFAIALPFGASMIVNAFSTTGFQLTKYLVYVCELFHPLTNLLFVFLLCTLGLGLNGIALAWLIAGILGSIAAFYFVRKVFPEITCRDTKPIFECKQLLSFSLPLAFGNLLWFGFLWTDILILGYYWSVAEVGIYRAASQTCFLLVIFHNSLNSIFAPMIADLFNRKDLENIRMLFQTATFWSFTLTLPILITMVIASKDIMFIFGTKFEAGWIVLIILGMGQFINAGTGGVGQMLVMSGHQYRNFFVDLGAVILNIVLNVVLIPKWGILGAAVATSTSIAIANLMLLLQVYLVLGVHPYSLRYLKTMGVSIVALLCGYVLHTWMPSIHFLLSLAITGCIIGLIYLVLTWAFLLEKVDRKLLMDVRKLIKL